MEDKYTNTNDDKVSKINDLFSELDDYTPEMNMSNENSISEEVKGSDFKGVKTEVNQDYSFYEPKVEEPIIATENNTTLSYDKQMEETRNINTASLTSEKDFDLENKLKYILSHEEEYRKEDIDKLRELLGSIEKTNPEEKENENNKQKVKSKKDDITTAFISTSILGFATAVIGGGWIAYIVNHL